jgi:hypothetical protein
MRYDRDPDRTAAETDDIEHVLPGGMTARGRNEVGWRVSVFCEAIPDARVMPKKYVGRGRDRRRGGNDDGAATRKRPRAPERFALAFDGPPAQDRQLVWVSAPAARKLRLRARDRRRHRVLQPLSD